MSNTDRAESGQELMVGMADLMVSQDQNLVLNTFPLGSCLGVAIYDPVTNVGGLLHSMLPDSSIDRQRAAARPGMFLDTGLASLLKHAEDLKVKPANLLIYVAGGSEVMDETASFNIGKRNFEVLTGLLAQRGLKIHASDVGGLANRAMQLRLATGDVRLRFSGNAQMRKLCKP